MLNVRFCCKIVIYDREKSTLFTQKTSTVWNTKKTNDVIFTHMQMF